MALDLPEGVAGEIDEWRAEAFGGRSEVRLPSAESLHATLVFLGYQAERDVARIAEAAFAERPAPFELVPLEVVEVPARRPRLFAVSLEDGGALVGWQGGLSERLHELGVYEPERRPFWPHVTVARVKTPRRRGEGGRRERPPPSTAPPPALPEGLRRPFRASRVTLYKSTLRPQGALYESLAELSASD